MPTGYTAKLMEEGQNFKEFVMCCSRAMGACISLRDQAVCEPPPEKFEPSEHYAKQIAKERKELERLEAMCFAEQEAFGSEKRADLLSRLQKGLDKDKEENGRLAQMRRSVQGWVPPTKDHEGLKKFMLGQLAMSLNATSYMEDEQARVQAQEPIALYKEALAIAAEHLKYSQKHQAEELERIDGRNKWLADLRTSLK